MGQMFDAMLSPEIRVYLLAENRLLRDTLARLLRKRAGINVVGVSRSSVTSKDEIVSSLCEVVLTDCFDGGADSDLLQKLFDQESGIKIVLFGMNADPGVFFKAVSLGICGYLLKDASSAEIVSAVLAAMRGEATCPPNLCMALMEYFCKRGSMNLDASAGPTSDKKTLTPRQLQLIRLVADGLTNKEIASSLNLSEFTVKNHIRRVMRRVEAASRYDAVDQVRATGQLPMR